MEEGRRWTIRLLGSLVVQRVGDEPTKIAPKTGELLIYLAGIAANDGLPLTRGVLGELLWPNQEGKTQLDNLREQLRRVRRIFEAKAGTVEDVIQTTTSGTVGLALDHIVVDAQQFKDLCTNRVHAANELQAADVLQEAISLYGGDFGSGYEFDSDTTTSRHFLALRNMHRSLYYGALYEFVKVNIALRHYDEAKYYFERLKIFKVTLEDDLLYDDTFEVHYEELNRLILTGGQPFTSTDSLYLPPAQAHRHKTPHDDLLRADAHLASHSLTELTVPRIPQTNLLGDDLTPFIGRATELGTLTTTFERHFHSRKEWMGPANRRPRLLTLFGMAGSGKTRIAKEFIQRLKAEASIITRFISLADVTEPEQLLLRIATALGIEQGGDLFLQVAYKLRTGLWLLVLDNLEHLTPSCNTIIVELLEHCPALFCIVTSQRSMQIAQETLIPINPMATPKAGDTYEQIMQYESVSLFEVRAQARQAAFRITPENVVLIARVICSLSGLPLALEMAAMKISVLTPEDMLKQTESLESLTIQNHVRDRRHLSLRTAFQWNFDLLSHELKPCFLALAYFCGGWTLEAAAAIWDSSPTEALAKTSDLIQCSLIMQEGQSRYAMKEALRLFADDCLAPQSGDLAAVVATRHAAYYQDFVRSRVASGSPSPTGRRQIDAEHENIMCVMLHLAQSTADREAEVQFGITLFDYWNHCNHWEEWRRWIERVLPHRRELSDATRRSLLCGAGALERLHSNYSATLSYYEEAAAIESDNVDQTLRLWERLGEVHRVQGNTEKAQGLLETCLSFYHSSGNGPETARTLDILAWVACDRGDIALGLQYAEQSLQRWRELGEADHRDEIASLYNSLGYIEMLRSDLRASRRYYNDSLAIRQKIGYQTDIAWTKNNLIPIAIAEQNFAEARTYFRESMRIFWELGQVLALAWGFTRGAQLELALNRVPQATVLLASAEQTYRQYKLNQPFTERAGHKAARDQAHSQLTAEDFAGAWHRGIHMSLDDAVSFALALATDEHGDLRP